MEDSTAEVRTPEPSHAPKRLLGLLVLLGGIPLVFGRIQWSFAGLADRDAYFHLGVSQILVSEGLVRRFPWTELSVWADRFSDPQWLLHLVLAPVLWVGVNPVVGGKVLSVLLATGLGVGVYALLSSWRVRWPLVCTAVLLSASPYLVARLCFLSSSPLLWLEILALLFALRAERPRLLLGIGAAAVYTSNGFPLFWVVTALFAAFLAKERGQGRVVVRLLGPLVAGSIAALVVHPYFPNDLWLLKLDLIDQIFARPAEVAAMPEWNGVSAKDLFALGGLPLATWVIAQLVAARARIGTDPMLVTLYLVTGGFLLLGMRWVWAVEAFVFFGVLSSALLISRALDVVPEHRQHGSLQQVVAGLFLFLYLPIAAFNVKAGAKLTRQKASEARPLALQGVSRWLTDHSEPGEIVVAAWTDFPMLLFFDHRNHYLFGLNPLYAHAKNERLYLAHRFLFDGKLRDPDVYLRTLSARYLLVSDPEVPGASRRLRDAVLATGQFDQVFSDGAEQLFRLEP